MTCDLVRFTVIPHHKNLHLHGCPVEEARHNLKSHILEAGNADITAKSVEPQAEPLQFIMPVSCTVRWNAVEAHDL